MKSTLKIAITTAIISVIFLFGSFTLFAWLQGKYDWQIEVSSIQGIAGLLSIPIQGIGIYMAMQNVKKMTGTLSYGQAIKTGLTVAITIAIIVSLSSFIYCQLYPGYTAFMIKDAQKWMLAKGVSQEQMVINSNAIARSLTTSSQVMMALVGQFITGAIMSLIIGLFIKSKSNSN